MYLAPLNYDRFFKKVFSSKRIAKRFLEDFLNIKIEKIDIVNTGYKVTDDAVAVNFDYRCKIKGQYIIIDMQQWYKSDVIKRFYVYHTLNTALQLEELPMKSIKISPTKTFETKNYDGVVPVYTLIWMADDNLKFKEDYISFAMSPEQTMDFLRNDALWDEKDLNKVLEERKKVLNLLNNDAKGLDFLPQNRLIYIFQKNIVLNKLISKYFKWFDFAEKTRKKENTKEDFAIYEKDEILMAVMQRLRKDKLVFEEFKEIVDYEKFLIQNKIHEDIVKRDMRKEMKEEVREEVKEEVREEVKEEVREEVKEIVRQEVEGKVRQEVERKVREQMIEIKNQEFVIAGYLKGLNKEFIAELTNLPLEKIENFIKKYESEKNK
jgi:hypothetical protein